MNESKELEFKIVLDRKHPEHWMKTVCAFAMTNGGKLMVGYQDDGSFVGIPSKNVDDEVQYAVHQFRHLSKPMVVYDVRYEERPEFPGRKGIIFQIQPRKEITWLTPHDHSPLAYIREERATLPAPVEVLQERLLESLTVPYDSVSTGVKRSEVSFSLLSDLYASKHDGRSLTERDLVSFGLVDKNGFLTITGYVFCDDSDYSNAQVLCTTWPETDKGGRNYLDSKTFSGSILQLIEKMMDYVHRVMFFQFGGVKKGMFREEDGSFSTASLREAFVNAVAHRDYRLSGPISLQCFPDRIEITSPGSMRSLKSVTNMPLIGVESDRRNQTISAMLARIGLMEERGSGFDLILNDYALLDERYTPRITATKTYFTLSLKNKKYDYGSLLGVVKGTSSLVHVPNTPMFSSRESLYKENLKYPLVEDLIRQNPNAKFADIQKGTGLTLGGAKYLITAMKKACLIRREGNPVNGHYEVVQDSDRPADFLRLDIESRTKAVAWCVRYFMASSAYDPRCTSIELKRTLEAFDGTYLSNGQFKGAMLLSGYKPQNEEDLNWVFAVSEKSPAFHLKK